MLTEIETKQPRFCIKYKNTYHRLFTYFTAASDGGLALHTYFPGNFVGHEYLENDFTDYKLDISNIDRERFTVHKTNFHKSGNIMQKNKNGFTFNKAISGKNLEYVNKGFSLFVLAPTRIDKYPRVDTPNKFYIINKFNEDIFPPVIQGYICNKNYEVQEIVNIQEINPILFIDKKILKAFGCDFYIYVRRSRVNKTYPSAEFLGIFTY